MTRWSDLWVKPSVMVAMGVEVRTADWLERIEKEGYAMEAKLEAIQAWAKEILGENYEAFRFQRINMNMLDFASLRKILEGGVG